MTWEMIAGAAVAAATLRLATPILLAALGGVISERAGVVNIALEGSMLVGAFFGVLAADRSHSIVVALAVAITAGTALAALHAVASIHFRSDQIVSGMALNILALGLTSYLDYQPCGTTGTPSDLPIPDLPLGALDDLLGAAAAIERPGLVALGLVVLLQLFLSAPSRPGSRAVGEHRATDTVGIAIRRTLRRGTRLRRARGALSLSVRTRSRRRRAQVHRARGHDLRPLTPDGRAHRLAHLHTAARCRPRSRRRSAASACRPAPLDAALRPHGPAVAGFVRRRAARRRRPLRAGGPLMARAPLIEMRGIAKRLARSTLARRPVSGAGSKNSARTAPARRPS